MQQQQATADGQVLQQTEYLYEPGSFRPMAQVTHHEQGSELPYIVTDHAGTPQELCNEQGDIVWQGEQALWGRYQQQHLLPYRGSREEAINDALYCDLRYQGQIEDRESGLYYNVNRYYDADSGQYLSPDPIGFAGGLRPQGYVHNPLEWVDPLGLELTGVDFTGSSALYPVSNGQQNIVKIKMTGSRYGDFKNANAQAGFYSGSGNYTGKSHPKGYTWHHLNDYDPSTNETTMQLVETGAHEATFPHEGSVRQFEQAHKVKYESKEAKELAKQYTDKPNKSC